VEISDLDIEGSSDLRAGSNIAVATTAISWVNLPFNRDCSNDRETCTTPARQGTWSPWRLTR